MNEQRLPDRLRDMPPEIPYTPPQLPPAYKTQDLLFMRVVGLMMVIFTVVAQAWVFLPFALAFMFRDWFAAWLYESTTSEQRALIRFAQWRLMGSAVASLYLTALYHAGTLTVIAIFVIAWIDVIWKLFTQPPAQPAQPALPAEVTHAVTHRPPDRIIRP